MESCIDVDLLSSSFDGTQVNVSQLLYSLMPLCANIGTKTKPIEVFANHSVTVFIGYFCGFIPWAFLVLFNSVSAKWKTILVTRRQAYLHMSISILPMAFVVCYAILQGLSGDYKEMMTAVSALMLILYHLSRTLWSMKQLSAYKSWCHDIMESFYQLDTNVEPARVDLDNELMVNEEIIDNEFSGRVNALQFDFRSKNLVLNDADVSTVRWTAAFSCAIGHKFCSDFKPLPAETKNILANCMFAADENDQMYTTSSLLQYCKEWRNESSSCGAFNSPIQELYSENVYEKYYNLKNELESYSFEVEGIASVYPPNETKLSSKDEKRIFRRLTNIDFVTLVLVTKSLGPDILRCIEKQRNKSCSSFICFAQKEIAWNLLQHQIPVFGRDQIGLNQVHSFWNLFITPIQIGKEYNNYLLQGSIHIDIRSALIFGNNINRFMPTLNLIQGDEYQKCKRLFQDLTQKAREHEQNVNGANDSFDSSIVLDSKARHVNITSNHLMYGARLDSLRTFLAKWILESKIVSADYNWNSVISNDVVEFNASKYLCKFCLTDTHLSDQPIIWEVQNILQKKVADGLHWDRDAPSKAYMAMLFVSSYPAIVLDVIEDTAYVLNMALIPVCVPQKVRIIINVHRASRSSFMSLAIEGDENVFQWQNWINCATALIKEHNRISRSIEEYGSRFQNADLSIDMKTFQDHRLKFPIHVWHGWPIINVQYTQFELDEWMSACDWKLECDYKKQRRQAVSTLQYLNRRIPLPDFINNS